MSSFSYRSSSDSSKSAGDGCEDPQSTSSGDEHFSKVKCPTCKTKHKIDTFRQDMAIDFIRKKSKKSKIRQDDGRGATSRSGSNR